MKSKVKLLNDIVSILIKIQSKVETEEFIANALFIFRILKKIIFMNKTAKKLSILYRKW